MNPRNHGEDGTDAKRNKRKHQGEDQVQVPKKGALVKRRKESSALMGEGKEDSDAYSTQVSNSALKILRGSTAKLQAQVNTSEMPGMSNTEAITTTPSPEVEGVTFPERLMELLMNETDKQALWWMPDGLSFGIHSKRFTKTILAKNFQGSKFESFTRKLARWGFKRLSTPGTPPHTFIFENAYFQRDRPELAKEVSGSKKKPPPPSSASSSSANDLKPPMASITMPVTEPTRPVPAPAPWPTVGNQIHHHIGDRSSTSNSASSGFYDDMIRQALLQQNLDSASSNARSDAITNHLLGRSMFNSFASARNTEDNSPSSLRSQQHQDALLSAAVAVEQDRARAVAAIASRSTTGTAPSNNLLGRLSTGLTMASLGQDSLDSRLTNLILQRQRQQSAPPPPQESLLAQDPLLRLFLQQQEANRQESILAQQELLMQEILRREQQQRDRDDWGRN